MEGLVDFLTMSGIQTTRHLYYRRKLEGFTRSFPNKKAYTRQDLDEYNRTIPSFTHDRPLIERYLRLQMKLHEGQGVPVPEPLSPTPEEAAAKYLNHRRRRGYRPETLDHDAYRLRVFNGFLRGLHIERIAEVDRQAISAFKEYMFRAVHSRGRGYVAAKQRSILQFVSLFFEWMVQEGLRQNSPCLHLTLPRVEKRVSRNILSRNEVDDFLAAIDVSTVRGFMDRTIFEVMYSTGLRITELRNLKLADLRLEDNLVNVIEGKGGKDRVAILTTVARRYLETFVNEVRPKHLKAGIDCGLVFPSPNGLRYKRVFLLNKIRLYCLKAGIGHHVSPHAFRRSFATHLLNEGVDVRHIQQLMGHDCVNTTMTYIQLAMKDLHEVLVKFHPREKELREKEIVFRKGESDET